MHSAPAVSYPVGRSCFQGWLVALIGLSGLLIVLLWVVAVDAIDWPQWLLTFGVLSTWSFAGNVWRRTAEGSLRWDGQAWGWQAPNASVSGILTVHLDLQFVLVVSLRTGLGARIWLWPERRAEALQWSALRRAVFCRCNEAPLKDTKAGAALKS